MAILFESADTLLLEDASDLLLESDTGSLVADPFPMTLTYIDGGHTLSLYERTFTVTLREGR
jgi:hypothetical protein